VSDLDATKLDQYLSAQLPDFKTLQAVEKFVDGQSNPTYRLKAASGDYVLRRKPFGELLKSAHAVDREFRVIRALQETDVPVPKALHLCSDTSVIGAQFYIMSYVAGQTYWNPALPEMDNTARANCYDHVNKTLAAIHSIDISAVGLSDYGKPGNYFARQTSRWTRQYLATETENIEEMNAVMLWLEANMIEDDGRIALVHGDFRIDNLMFDASGQEVLAVLDWELSTLGHPFADLAYQCALWRLPPEAALAGLAGIDRAQLNIPTEALYVEKYCQRTGVTRIEHWHFYLVFSLFRMAAIVQGVKKRALEGNASSEHAMRVGALTIPLAREAATLI